MAVALIGSRNPLDHFVLRGKKVGTNEFPDIIEFCLSPEYLGRTLYPRQATLLKLIFLEVDLLTDYDYEIIEHWKTGFRLPEEAVASFDPEEDATMRYIGDWGIVPDVLDRIKILRQRDYRWFRTVLSVLGRRSGKGYIGGLAGAYVLWYYLKLSDPRDHFGVDRDKRFSAQVFAGKKMQARDNQWRDIVNVILGAPCFAPYISTSLTETLTVYSPQDLIDLGRGKGADSTMDQATFEIVPKEATTMAARGPASFMQFYDEMAHMVQTSGGLDKAEDVYESATPSLDQFGTSAFIYAGSSPWTMSGKFYELCQQALQVDAETKKPVYPDSLLIQLESWNIYEDWERTRNTRMTARPTVIRQDALTKEERTLPEIVFHPLRGAIQTYDERMQRLERANPDTFRVERRSKWAASMDAYFPEEHVRRMFYPFQGARLVQQTGGSATIDYVCHGDPGKTGSNFGFAMAHKVHVPGSELPHVVFDVIHAWMPQDFPDGMDYMAIENDLKKYIDDFLPVSMSFDQWNSLGLIQRLATHARTHFKVARIWERSATAPLNWRTAETMKAALSLNLIHAPVHDLFELECLFLRKLPGDKVDHPSSGPVTTKDVYDAVSIVIHELIGDDVASYMGDQFSSLSASPGMPGPNSPDRGVVEEFSRFSAERLQRPGTRPRGAGGGRGPALTRGGRRGR